jgi:hypothetical protein
MPMNGSFNQHTVVQARSESPTLGLEEDEDASAMLAALDIKRSPSKIRRLAPPQPASPLTRLPLPSPPLSDFSASTPNLTHGRLGQHSRRGSVSSSDVTSLATPVGSLSGSSVRESSILPRGSNSTFESSARGSASSSYYGRPLDTLPENGRRLVPGLSKIPSVSWKDYQIHRSDAGVAPPSAYSSHKAQVNSAQGTYQMEGRMPVLDQRSPSLKTRPQVPSPVKVEQGQDNSYLPYLGSEKAKHLSANTECSSSSSYSTDSRTKVDTIVLGNRASTVSGLTDFHFHLDDSSSTTTNDLSRFETGSSGSTGTSSKAMAKKEKQA